MSAKIEVETERGRRMMREEGEGETKGKLTEEMKRGAKISMRREDKRRIPKVE